MIFSSSPFRIPQSEIRNSPNVPRALLAILRVYLGVILLITNLGKLTRDSPFSTEMLGFCEVSRRAAHPRLTSTSCNKWSFPTPPYSVIS
jgi:hypothetical protein